MKRILPIIILFATIATQLFAQRTQNSKRQQAAQAPPLPVREVSGIVKDSSDATLPGSVVKLESPKDTMSTSTNADGIFIFKNVKSATFVLTVTSIGYRKLIKKFLNNDAVPRLVLDPVVLTSEAHALKEVVINGTPSITYKTDTVEYRASDYKVRENATVDELLKKMEGMEVGSDGSLTHQGQEVTKAKLNGKEYAGGDVAKAIQNLPAEIVEKIQIVDDYGDQAARTGIKDGDPQKVLNITTRADRSVGTTGRVVGQAGNNGRYNAQLFVQRINANQQIGIIGRLANTVNGVASSGIAGGATNGGGGGSGVGAGSRGGSPGTTRSGSPGINYRDQYGKKVQVNGSYSYSFRDNDAYNNSYGEDYTQLGNSSFRRNGTSQSNNLTHNLRFEMDYTIDSANYLQITPSFSYTNSENSANNFQDRVNLYNRYPGFSHVVTNGITNKTSNSPDYGAIVFYQHIFKKPHRNVSLQLSLNRTNNNSNSDNNTLFQYYTDTLTTLNHIKDADSISHPITYRTSDNTTYRISSTYVEPLSLISQLEFNGQIRHSSYDNTAMSDTVGATGQVYNVPSLSNIYNYAFTESRFTLNYRYNGEKVNLSLGTTMVPYMLNGTKLNNTTSANVETSRSFFRIIPVFRFSYSWSRTQRFTLSYSGSNNEPSFQQIQPFRDESNPDNIIVGNPDLKPTFRNSVSAAYNNYFPNSRFNISLNANATLYDDQINTNTLHPAVLIKPAVPPTGPDDPGQKAQYKTINEVHYVNLGGSKAYVGRYSISKQLADRRYNLSLNGNISYRFDNNMSDDLLYHITNWRFDERFGPRINPNDNVEVNPFVGYDISRIFSTAKGSTPTSIQTTSLGIDGKFYFFKTFQVNYSATKSYVTGLKNFDSSPLVINAGFEKEFFAKRNLVLTFNMFDLLHQNNFIQLTTLPNGGYTNTLSNTLSRYFLVGLRLNLQKWSGRPSRHGKELKRRGDGSFIY